MPALSRRLQTIQLAAEGYLNKQIARLTGLRETTVKQYLGQEYNRRGLVRQGMNTRILLALAVNGESGLIRDIEADPAHDEL